MFSKDKPVSELVGIILTGIKNYPNEFSEDKATGSLVWSAPKFNTIIDGENLSVNPVGKKGDGYLVLLQAHEIRLIAIARGSWLELKKAEEEKEMIKVMLER